MLVVAAVAGRSGVSGGFAEVLEGRGFEEVRAAGLVAVDVRFARGFGVGAGVGVGVGFGVGLGRRPKSRWKNDGFFSAGFATATGVAFSAALRELEVEACCATE